MTYIEILELNLAYDITLSINNYQFDAKLTHTEGEIINWFNLQDKDLLYDNYTAYRVKHIDHDKKSVWLELVAFN